MEPETLTHWLPALAFGVIMFLAVRLVKRPLVIPIVLAVGLALFAIGMLVTGSSIDDARIGLWMLGPYRSGWLFQPWTFRALTGADWWAVLGQAAGIATVVFVAVIGVLFNVSGTELVLDRDLDTNRELRDAGLLNVVSGAFGGVPGYHALSLTTLADRMHVDARAAGLIASLVPLAAVVFGAAAIALIPRMIVGGVLVFLGLAFIVDWVWDKRRTLPRLEYAVVLVILAGIIAKGFLPGVVIGLVMAVILFAVSYGRVELVDEVAFGDTRHSNVDRPPAERAALRTMGARVQILRVRGFVFFGSASGLLERIRTRVETAPPRCLLMDLRQVTGVDASAVMSFVNVIHLAESNGFELVLAGASDPVRKQLERGGVVASDGVVRFEPDLDRGLQRCEDILLEEAHGRAALEHRRGRRSRRTAAGLATVPRARDPRRGDRADPPGRAARRRVRAGVRPPPGGDGDARGDADAPAHGAARRGGRRDRDVHGRRANRGRGRRDAERRDAAQPGVDRTDGGRRNRRSPRRCTDGWPRRSRSD